MKNLAAVLLLCVLALPAAAQTRRPKPRVKPVAPTALPTAEQLDALAARFAPTPLRVATAKLSAGDRAALPKLIEAARILNDLYMDQLWSGNRALYRTLQADTSPLGRARLRYFWINKGPWDDLNEFKAFVPGVPARKPLGANFYPDDLTKADFEAWLKTLAPEPRAAAESYFTIIRRGANANLAIVPYHEAYAADLDRCAALLREAAAATDNATLKRFLTARADAFRSNDYYQSDVAWMDLDAPLDVTIGPYETYTDELFGYKAAFEAYVSLRDDRETAKLTAFAQHLQEIENNLPIDAQYRNPKLGGQAPIRVVNEIIATGDAAHGVMTAAYNLPNDERVVREKGSKRVMLKNVQEAKFRSVLVPIATRMLARRDQADVSFNMFFTHILAHELMHGLGPHNIRVAGRDTTVRLEMKDLYGAIEEAKADVTGLFALQYMMDHAAPMKLGRLLPADEAAQRQLYVTFLASAFRSLRFGLNDAHGKGMALQFNYLSDRGGFIRRPDGTFHVNLPKMKAAVRALTHDLLTLEATGDYAGAKKMLETLGVIRPPVQAALDRLTAIPTDIEPIFATADQLTGKAVATADDQTAPAAKKKSARKKRRR